LPIVDGADIRFMRFSTQDGPAKSNAGPFVQDDQGFVWFGTPYGLNRFDGYTYKVFVHDASDPTSISGSYITSIFKDHQGYIWVGCNGFLNKLDTRSETFKRYNLPFVVHISQDTSGLIWLSAPTGLYALNPATGGVRRYFHDPTDPQSLESSDVKSSGEDRNGQFWVATSEGFDSFDRRTGKVTLHIPMDEASHPFSFYEDRFGVFWIYHVSGDPLAVFDRKTSTLTRFSFRQETSHSKPLTGITGMVEDHDGALWLSTNGAGVLKFDREHQRFIRYRHSLADPESIAQDSVNNMFEDREGIIWLGLGGSGLTRFTSKALPFRRYRHDFGDPRDQDEPFVGAIHEDRHGILWIGSHNGLHRIDRAHERYRTFHLTGNGEGSDVISLCEDRAGYLWVGTYSHGLFRFDERTGHARRFQHDATDPHSLSNDIVPRILVDHNGVLWAATHDGLDRYDAATGGFTTYRIESEGAHPYYLELVEDRNAIMWLGTESSGLESFDPATSKFEVYQHEADRPGTISNNRVNSIHFDRSGTMWVGTQEGLNQFDPVKGTFTLYAQREGLPGIVVGCVLEDSHGALWMSTDNGVASFDPHTRVSKRYSMADGIPGPDLTGWGACFRSPTGEMFFGGFSGATSFFPDHALDSSYVPPTALTELRLFGAEVLPGADSPIKKTLNYANEITLDHKQNIFAIEFSALSYLNPSTNRYRYRLEGLDSKWIEVGSDQRFASYTTLPPGLYIFRVQGATSRGDWSEPGASIQINVLPAWWNRWWFRAIYVTAALLMLWGIYQLRLRQIAMEHNIRLEERLSERTRISRELHDTLLQGFQGLSLRFQAVMNALPGDSAARELIEDVLDRADQVLLEGRRSVRELREDPLTDGDLPDSLARCGEMLAQGHTSIFSLFVIGTPRPLSTNVCNEAYRIGREGLVNAFRHSRASKIQVEITYSDHGARMIIRDDGIGIDQKTLTGGLTDHWGLSGMRERAQRIGGTLKIWSRPGAGTEIEFTILAEQVYRPGPKRSPWYRPSFFTTSVRKESDSA
jgi:ligand-binding sensor domain-containing protein